MDTSIPSVPLKPETALLVVVDLQVGHIGSIKTMPPDRLVLGSVLLCQVAKELDVPVLVTISKQSPPQGLLVPELASLNHLVIERTKINAWEDEAFRNAIAETGRTQLIFTGVALDVGVTLPALGARRSGFQVTVPIDAVGCTDDRIEGAALLNLAQSGVSLSSVQAIGMGLLAETTSPHVADVFFILGRAHRAEVNPFVS